MKSEVNCWIIPKRNAWIKFSHGLFKISWFGNESWWQVSIEMRCYDISIIPERRFYVRMRDHFSTSRIHMMHTRCIFYLTLETHTGFRERVIFFSHRLLLYERVLEIQSHLMSRIWMSALILNDCSKHFILDYWYNLERFRKHYKIKRKVKKQKNKNKTKQTYKKQKKKKPAKNK